MREKIINYIEKESILLSGFLMLFFYLMVNLIPKFIHKFAKYQNDLPHVEILLIILGIGLIIYSFIPEKVSPIFFKLRYWLIQASDKLTPKTTLYLIFLLTALGFYLRLHNLGVQSFWIDEAITSYAAMGLMNHGEPILPSGVIYNRALLNTYLIALSFKIFGTSEFSARIVSVIFGTLTIPLVYLLAEELENKRVGIIAALLITFSSFQILWSREARMYAQFQFFYLLTAYLFYLGLKRNNGKLLFSSVISFIFALYSHVLSFCFIPVAVASILLDRRKFLKNKTFLYVSSGFLGLLSVYIFMFNKNPIRYLTLTVPKWSQHTFLHYVFAPTLFTLLVLVVISSVISILLWKLVLPETKNQLYFIINFFIPFAILSIYPQKTLRYAFFIFPFLVILALRAIDFYAISDWDNMDTTIYNQISTRFKIKREYVENIKSIVTVIFILLILIHVSSDIYYMSKETHEKFTLSHENWEKAGTFVKERLDDTDKVAATVSLTTLYYVGRIDYLVCQNECPEYTNNDGVTVDFYAGCTILHNYDLFMQTVTSGEGWLIADQGRLDGYWTDQKVRDYIRNNMTYYPEGSDETIEVYSWGDVSL